MAHKLILNKGGEEQVLEFSDIEKAFDGAEPWILNGYIARVTDGQGIVKYTQALTNGQIASYSAPRTTLCPGSEIHDACLRSSRPPENTDNQRRARLNTTVARGTVRPK